MMKAPAFWYPAPGQRKGPLPWLLAPLSLLFRAGGWLRGKFTHPYQAPVPVICVGNLTVGGAGKTPTVLALAGRLIVQGVNVHCLTRGHGGSLTGPLRVDPAIHTADKVGDEPLLLAAIAPTWVARNRKRSAMAAVEAGAELLLLDDGYQNQQLAKDVSLLLVDVARGVGNGWVLPAGPLREPLRQALARASATVIVGSGACPMVENAALLHGVTLLRAKKAAMDGAALAGRKLFAFCGIGAPEQFFSMLRLAGAGIAGTKIFPDHYPYTDNDISRLLEEAAGSGAELITTQKDLMRLRPPARMAVRTLPIEMRFDDEQALLAALAPALSRLQARKA